MDYNNRDIEYQQMVLAVRLDCQTWHIVFQTVSA